MKPNTSVEKLIEYRDHGWKFSVRTVKGKRYITVRRKGEERSLGPYSDELWGLIQEILGGRVKEAESQSTSLPSSSGAEVGVSEAVVGLKVVKAIKALGVGLDDALGFVEEIYKEAVNQHLEPETFVKVAKEMYGLKVEGHGDYLALERDVEGKRGLFEGFEKRASEYEQKGKVLSKANDEATRKLEEMSKLLELKAELVGKVKEAEALNVSPSQLGFFVEMARKVGSSHGLGIKDSVMWLVKDLEENWEPKLGFENEKTRLSVELDQLNVKIMLAERKENVTQEKVRAQEQALQGLEELKKHVSAEEIIDFKKVIVDSGQDVATFRREVEELGNLTDFINLDKQKKKAELALVSGRVTALSAQESQLTDSKKRLEAEINTLNSEAIKGILNASKTITGVADGLKLDFEAPGTGYKARIQSLGDEAIADVREQFKLEREALRKSSEEMCSAITRSASEVEKLKENTWEIGKLVGISVHLARIGRLIAGENLEKVSAVSTMKMTVDSFIGYLERNKLANKCPSSMQFSKELRGILP